MLGSAILAELVSSDTASSEPVAAALEPVPEGPDFRLSRGDPQWNALSLPARPPEPVPQTCETGSNVVLTFSDGRHIAYGPCRRPRVIELLRADLLSVAHEEDLRASVAPACAKRLLSDWFDNGRVDELYRRVCYEGAVELLPESMEDLGRAEAVIRIALCAWAVCDKNTVAEAQQSQLAEATLNIGGRPTSPGQLCHPDAEKPPCGVGAHVGADYDYVLYTHCGVAWAIFDGRLWLAQSPLHDDGVRGAPAGWGDPTQPGVMRLLGDERAEFRAGSLVAAFAPAPPGYAREACD